MGRPVFLQGVPVPWGGPHLWPMSKSMAMSLSKRPIPWGHPVPIPLGCLPPNCAAAVPLGRTRGDSPHPEPWGGWVGVPGPPTPPLSPLPPALRAPAALQAGGREAPVHVPHGHDRRRHRPPPLLPLRGVALPGRGVPFPATGEPRVRGQHRAVTVTRGTRGKSHPPFCMSIAHTCARAAHTARGPGACPAAVTSVPPCATAAAPRVCHLVCVTCAFHPALGTLQRVTVHGTASGRCHGLCVGTVTPAPNHAPAGGGGIGVQWGTSGCIRSQKGVLGHSRVHQGTVGCSRVHWGPSRHSGVQ